MVNLGKKFEEIVKRDFLELYDAKITRLYDPVGGYGGIKNICDFIAYKYPLAFYFEVKETKENTFNFSKLTQFDALCDYANIRGLHAGVLVWFSAHNKVMWASIELIKKLKDEGIKSINVNNAYTYDLKLQTTIVRKYPKINFYDFYIKIFNKFYKE